MSNESALGIISESRWRGRTPLVAIVVIILAGFSVYYYQTQATIASLQERGTFNHSIVLLQKTTVILHPCTRIGCDVKFSWNWNFPYNRSLQFPGYLNLTIYSSNATNAIMAVSWKWSNGNGSGFEEWDYSTGAWPRTTPGWMIVPVFKTMEGLAVQLSPQTFFTSEQSISISYYY